MTSVFDLVTFDSPSPDVAAAFWCAALTLHETEREDGDRWIVLSDGHGVRRIGLQRGSAHPGTVHLVQPHRQSAHDRRQQRQVLSDCRGVVAEAVANAMLYGNENDPARRVIVEIGCGFGEATIAMAAAEPEVGIVAVDVHTRGGLLTIAWAGPGQPVLMTGPAQTVYTGDIDLPTRSAP